jgi:tetratricopeptide (TPR) repeat protein
MVDLLAEPGGDLLLRWTDAPGDGNKTIPRAEIARLQRLTDAVSLAENRGQTTAIVEARTALSSALFELLDGPERALAQRIDAAEAAHCRLDLVVRARTADPGALGEHPATWMRWELLPFAETRRGAPPFTVVLQLGPLDLAPPRVLASGGLRILFMAFSPHDAPPELDFEHEEETLLVALAPLAERRRARLRVVEEGTLDDLRATLLAERFDVVHLTGHGLVTPEGPRLVMEDTFGSQRLVSPAELIDVLEHAKAMPELVMLSTCHSAEVRGSVASFAAALVAAGVPNVLGWTRPVRDDQATLAAAAVYEQLGAGKTPVEAAELARERMRRSEERSLAPTHAWGTLHLVSSAAAGFRVDEHAAPLRDFAARDEVYQYVGSRMRVLKTGFVGRRRLVQRLLRVLLRGQDARPDGVRDVAGACVFGMKGVGKSCAVGRAIERAKQVAPELLVVIVHGVIDGRSVLDAFQDAIATSGGDEAAERLLALADEPVFRRARRVMEGWRGRHVAIVLDDFEQNLERRSDGPWLVAPHAAALLEVLLPTCTMGKPKLLITSTAELQVPGGHEQALAFVPLGSFDAAAVQKLWMRGQASNELACVSLKSWQHLAERLGCNARILTWARALLARKADDELAAIARHATVALPVWKPGDEASEEKHAELARLFLRHMAHEQARAAFGEDALAFVKRARVFEAAVPNEAFVALTEGLAVDLDRGLDALASWGLLEVGEIEGARVYRVSPLVEPTFEVADAARWHDAAAAAWEALAEKAANDAVRFERVKAAWEHALLARSIERADRLARWIQGALFHTGLNTHNLRLAERHMKALPKSPIGHQWAGYAAFKAGQPGPYAIERFQHGHALLIRALGTEEHRFVAASWGMLGEVLKAHGDLAGARKALERSLDIWAKVLSTEDQPFVAASWHALAGVLQAQGDLAGARRTIERALAIHADVLGTDLDPNVAASLHTLGGVLQTQGDLAGARKAFEHSLAIHAKVFGTEEHPSVAASLRALGTVLSTQGDLVGARNAIERSLAIDAKVLGTEQHLSVAASLLALRTVLHNQGDLAGARKAVERALAIQAKVLGTEEHPSVATSWHALGTVLHAQGNLVAARKAVERSLVIDAKVHGTEQHPSVAVSWHTLGAVLLAQGDLAGARNALERSLAIHAKVLGTEEHPSVASSWHELGKVLMTQGDFAGARKAIERSLAITAKVLGTEEHPSVAISMQVLSTILWAQADLAGARGVVERALDIWTKVPGAAEHREVAAALHQLGVVLHAQGDFAGARKAVERSLAIWAKVLDTEDHFNVATSLHQLAVVLRDQQDFDGARAALERSLSIYSKVLGTEEHPNVAVSLQVLANVLWAQGDLGGARRALERSLAIKAKVLGTDDHPDVAASLHALGTVLHAQGDLGGARHALERSLAIKAKVLNSEDHEVAASWHELGVVLEVQGDLIGARHALERSLAIMAKVLGTDEHPTVAVLWHTLGGVLMAQGDLVGARHALERSLTITARILGTEEHTDIAASLYELARVLHAQGDLGGARHALERALAIWAKVLGTEKYPEIAAAWHQLGVVLHEQGDLGGARHALERALAIWAKVLGTERHPSVAASFYELARVIDAQGDPGGARHIRERALAIQAEVLSGTIQDKGRPLTHAVQSGQPCSCGSGKPFHSCHGATDDQQSAPPCPCGSGKLFPACHGISDDQ